VKVKQSLNCPKNIQYTLQILVFFSKSIVGSLSERGIKTDRFDLSIMCLFYELRVISVSILRLFGFFHLTRSLNLFNFLKENSQYWFRHATQVAS
jgi:hypothetical protein